MKVSIKKKIVKKKAAAKSPSGRLTASQKAKLATIESGPIIRKSDGSIIDTSKVGTKKKKPIKVHDAVPNAAKKKLQKNIDDYYAYANSPRFGDAIMLPDDKGFDGHDSLKTEKFFTKKFKRTAEELAGMFEGGNKKLTPILLSAVVYNIWQWTNWCERAWNDSRSMEPPQRRLVVINAEDIFPFADIEGILDHYVNLLRKDSDFLQALSNLGTKRYRVRLIIKIANCKTASLNVLNNIMCKHTGIKTVQGFYLTNFDEVPRELGFQFLKERKSLKELDKSLDTFLEEGQRVVISLKTLRLAGNSVSEIAKSPTYSKLKKLWGLQTPLIEVKKNLLSENKLKKLSQLGDVILV